MNKTKKIFGIFSSSVWVLVILVAIAIAATMTVTFQAPTTREDGTNLPNSEIAYYEIGYGTVSRGTGTTYPNIVHVNNTGAASITYQVLSVPTGTYYLAARTWDIYGNSSVWSSPELMKFIVSPPGAPKNTTVVNGLGVQ